MLLAGESAISGTIRTIGSQQVASRLEIPCQFSSNQVIAMRPISHFNGSTTTHRVSTAGNKPGRNVVYFRYPAGFLSPESNPDLDSVSIVFQEPQMAPTSTRSSNIT